MNGSLTTESEKLFEFYPFKCKVKEPYPIKIKPKPMKNDIFIQNILKVEAIKKM